MNIRRLLASLFPGMLSALVMAVMTFPPVVPVVHGMLQSGELIYPGVGIDIVKIGEPIPAKLPQHLEQGRKEKNIVIDVQGNQNTVTRITITSPNFTLAHSQLRVQTSTLDDVRRFYGEGKNMENMKSDTKQTVLFSSEGLEFVINKKSGKVESISVFAPERPKMKIQQYKKFKEDFKQ